MLYYMVQHCDMIYRLERGRTVEKMYLNKY